MKERLWLGMKSDGGIRSVLRAVGCCKFSLLEPGQFITEDRRFAEHRFTVHLAADLLLLHLRGAFEPLRHGLRGKSFIINTLYGIEDEPLIFHHDECVIRKKMQERNLLRLCDGQFRHDLYL